MMRSLLRMLRSDLGNSRRFRRAFEAGIQLVGVSTLFGGTQPVNLTEPCSGSANCWNIPTKAETFWAHLASNQTSVWIRAAIWRCFVDMSTHTICIFAVLMNVRSTPRKVRRRVGRARTILRCIALDFTNTAHWEWDAWTVSWHVCWCPCRSL